MVTEESRAVGASTLRFRDPRPRAVLILLVRPFRLPCDRAGTDRGSHARPSLPSPPCVGSVAASRRRLPLPPALIPRPSAAQPPPYIPRCCIFCLSLIFFIILSFRCFPGAPLPLHSSSCTASSSPIAMLRRSRFPRALAIPISSFLDRVRCAGLGPRSPVLIFSVYTLAPPPKSAKKDTT